MKDLQIIQNDDGVFDVYDDTYDIIIHCTSQEEQDNVLEKLNREECSDAISRTEALANAHSMGVMIDADADEDDGGYYIKNPKYKSFDIVEAEIIKALPPVTPTEKVGQWEWEQESFTKNWGNWHCSKCREIITVCETDWAKINKPNYEYCPNCGAKMQEVEDA